MKTMAKYFTIGLCVALLVFPVQTQQNESYEFSVEMMKQATSSADNQHSNITQKESGLLKNGHSVVNSVSLQGTIPTKICKDSLGEFYNCSLFKHCKNKDWGTAVFMYERTCAKCLGALPGWLLYLFLATVPTTVFFILVFGCGIRATSAPMNAFVCICQVLLSCFTMNYDYFRYFAKREFNHSGFTYFNILTKTFATFFGFWNLDLFRYVIPPFCISKDLTTLDVLAMEYIVAIYPLLFIVVAYICIELHGKDFKPFVLIWMPFKKCLFCFRNYIPKLTIIEAFATFFILGYSKLLFTSFNLLVPTTTFTTVFQDNGSHISYVNASRVMLYDISIPYLSDRHIPFFILAIVFLVFFNVLPFLILLLYPTRLFQKALGCCTRIQWHPLHAFVDAIQGCYKNGTNGTSDCRYFSALYLLVRAIYRIPEFAIFTDSTRYTTCFILTFQVFSIAIGLIQPYRNKFYNKWDMLVFFIMPLPQLFYGVQLVPLGTAAEVLVIGWLTLYFIGIAAYKVVTVCAPGIVERWRETYCAAHICKCCGGTDQTNRDVEDGLASDTDLTQASDDELPDRLVNPDAYREMTASADGGGESRSARTLPISGCHYTYGSVN